MKNGFITRKFISKPVEVEAFVLGMDVLPEWFSEKINKTVWLFEDFPENFVSAKIKIDEGFIIVKKYDYIIKGVSGEIYACSKDIFDKLYEEVEE